MQSYNFLEELLAASLKLGPSIAFNDLLLEEAGSKQFVSLSFFNAFLPSTTCSPGGGYAKSSNHANQYYQA